MFLHGFGGREDDWADHFPLLPPDRVGEDEDVIEPALVTASQDRLRAHTAARLVRLPGEGHMLSSRFAEAALRFTADAHRALTDPPAHE